MQVMNPDMLIPYNYFTCAAVQNLLSVHLSHQFHFYHDAETVLQIFWSMKLSATLGEKLCLSSFRESCISSLMGCFNHIEQNIF